MPQQRERDGGPVAERLVAFVCEAHQDVDVAVASLGHGQAQADELRLRGEIGRPGGFLVPVGCLFGVAGGIQQARFQQGAVNALGDGKGLVGRRERVRKLAVAPVQMSDGQPGVGALTIGPGRVVGRGAETFDRVVDAPLVKDRTVEEGADRLRFETVLTARLVTERGNREDETQPKERHLRTLPTSVQLATPRGQRR